MKACRSTACAAGVSVEGGRAWGCAGAALWPSRLLRPPLQDSNPIASAAGEGVARCSLLLWSGASGEQVAARGAAATPRLGRGRWCERAAKQLGRGGHGHGGGALALALVLAAGGDAGQLGAAGGGAFGDDSRAALLQAVGCRVGAAAGGSAMDASRGGALRQIRRCFDNIAQRRSRGSAAAQHPACAAAQHTTTAQHAQRTCMSSCG